MRNYPPERRRCETTKGKVGQTSIFVNVGFYSDGKPAEIFVDIFKSGSDLKAFYVALAQSISLGLQHGIEASEFTKTLRGADPAIDFVLACVDDKFKKEAE